MRIVCKYEQSTIFINQWEKFSNIFHLANKVIYREGARDSKTVQEIMEFRFSYLPDNLF